jgi:hypothetical protein
MVLIRLINSGILDIIYSVFVCHCESYFPAPNAAWCKCQLIQASKNSIMVTQIGSVRLTGHADRERSYQEIHLLVKQT